MEHMTTSEQTYLEIKRTSITRLKRQFHTAPTQELPVYLKSKEPRLRDWNAVKLPNACRASLLEIKRTSITRLKRNLWYLAVQGRHWCLKSKEPRLRDWNRCKSSLVITGSHTWNQKNLDYEIETGGQTPRRLERITRLKSKEPRLRDWNNRSRRRSLPTQISLEIKRTSITRLKHAMRSLF